MLDQLKALSVISSDVSGIVSTGPLSAVSAAAFCELPYSPALLLDSSFSTEITDDPRFHKACAYGFDDYFEEMYEWNGDESVFVAQSFSWADVIAFVIENVLHWRMIDLVVEPAPAWDAGFVLGWLSAHALVDRPVSLMALEVLRALIESLLSVAVQPCVRKVGGDGWPLDM